MSTMVIPISNNDTEIYVPIKQDRLFESIHDRNTVDNNESIPNIIYRFKFTDDFMQDLYKFSKIHQYDDRKDFKESWKLWTEENDEIVCQEISRLSILGYEGNVLEKMFKSARYYFRKKCDVKKEPKQRRQYISVNKELLSAMDLHIETNIYNESYQPKLGFSDFCNNNESLLKESIAKIMGQGVNETEIIELKIKKTYKNRYFMITNGNTKLRTNN
jgi:hypothetical protein